MSNKHTEDVKLEIKSKESSSGDEHPNDYNEFNEEEEEGEETEIIDIDQATDQNQICINENNKDEAAITMEEENKNELEDKVEDLFSYKDSKKLSEAAVDDDNLLNDKSTEKNHNYLKQMNSVQRDKINGGVSSTSRNIANNESELKAGRTVLTRMTEKLYDKCVTNNKDKLSVYDFLVHDEHIKRFIDKNDQASNSKKINDFITRNQGFVIKNHMKKQENFEKNRQKIVSTCHGIPNNKDLKKENIRNINDFLSDQLNFVSTRNTKLVEMKSQQTQKERLLSSERPVMSASSTKLATKRNTNQPIKNIHERLNKTPLNKLKTHNVKEQSITSNQSKHMKNKSINIVNYGKKNLSPKNFLPVPQQQRPDNKIDEPSRLKSPQPHKSIERIKSPHRVPPTNNNPVKTEALTSISSKLIILEKFLKNYELCLLNMFNVKYGASVNFDGFCKILNILGFVTNDCSSTLIQKHNDEEKIDPLATNLNTFSKMHVKTNKNYHTHAEKEKETVKECWTLINKEKLEKIDSNQILIFLSSILGLYDGEEKNDEITTAGKSGEKNLINHQFLKKLIPEINFENYSYPKLVVKQFKIVYRELYENRMNFIMDAKTKNYAEKKSHENKDLVFKPKISTNSLKSADNFRKKCLNEANYDTNSTNGVNIMQLQEIYNMRKLKKENELAKMKLQQEEKILKECTFKPEIRSRGRSTKDIGKKLYIEAFNRANKQNVNEKKKEIELKLIDNQHTFSPELTSFKPNIFEDNPLQNDNLVKKGIERYERARIEKKIAEVQTTKGIATFNDLKNIEALIKEDCNPVFRFNVDVKFNKNTIEKRTKGQYNNNNNNKLNTGQENYQSRDKLCMSSNNTPILILEINIDDKKKEKLEIYSDDDAVEVSTFFCEKHNLDDEKKIYLIQLINDKIKDKTA